MGNDKLNNIYANIIYEKLENEKDDHNIARILEAYFVLTNQLEDYDEKYIGGLEYDKMRRYEPLVLGMTETLKQTSLWEGKSAVDFYNTLWKSIDGNDVLSTKESKIFSLWIIAKKGGLPFFEINFSPLKMDDKKFQNLIEKNKNRIEKIEYIQNLKFSQRTEEASVILNEILSLDDFDDQVLLFSVAIQIATQRERLNLAMSEWYQEES